MIAFPEERRSAGVEAEAAHPKWMKIQLDLPWHPAGSHLEEKSLFSEGFREVGAFSPDESADKKRAFKAP